MDSNNGGGGATAWARDASDAFQVAYLRYSTSSCSPDRASVPVRRVRVRAANDLSRIAPTSASAATSNASSDLLLLLGELPGRGCCTCSIGTHSTGGTVDLANKGCNYCPWRTGGEIGEIGEAGV